MLSETTEDYLRAIEKLSGKGGARITDIAKALGLAKSSVSERIRALERQGLVHSEPYAAVTLTKKGEALARRVTYRHRVIETFLHGTLGVPKTRVHDEAHRLEHAFSDDIVRRLDAFLGEPSRDPHGSAITR